MGLNTHTDLEQVVLSCKCWRDAMYIQQIMVPAKLCDAQQWSAVCAIATTVTTSVKPQIAWKHSLSFLVRDPWSERRVVATQWRNHKADLRVEIINFVVACCLGSRFRKHTNTVIQLYYKQLIDFNSKPGGQLSLEPNNVGQHRPQAVPAKYMNKKKL